MENKKKLNEKYEFSIGNNSYLYTNKRFYIYNLHWTCREYDLVLITDVEEHLRLKKFFKKNIKHKLKKLSQEQC